MATLFLIRHGEPTLTGVFLGQLDPPLSETGRLQCLPLKALHVEAAWSSPLLRARQTASFLNTASLHEHDGLREIGYGEWTGKSWAEIQTTWKEWAGRKEADWLATPAPGGEPWPDFVQRLNMVWNHIRNGPHPAAVVAHAGVNAALNMLITGSDPLQFQQTYGEVIRVEFD